ncbi:MAG: hypothetical protein AAF599_14760 [Bacteroidota bacterium]
MRLENVEISGGVLHEETGKVVWKFQLEAGEEESRVIAYSVKYPKERYVLVD